MDKDHNTREGELKFRAAIDRLGTADQVISRVLDVAGVRQLGLDALLRLSGVAWSADVASACVECKGAPRMLLNPQFVERHCAKPRALAFLILHELAHVSLGHTGLHVRVTPVQNVAFDAIINASLLQGLVDAGRIADGWDALVTSCYAPDRAPEFLLRPPPGWPDQPRWDASGDQPPRLRSLHRRLYDKAPCGSQAAGSPMLRIESVTYGEIIAALTPGPDDGELEGGDGTGAILRRLLGAHGTTDVERAAASGGRDMRAAELLAEVLAHLPRDPSFGAVAGEDPFAVRLEGRRDDRLVTELRGLMRRALISTSVGRRLVAEERAIMTVDPSGDRRVHARRYAATRLGAPPPLMHVGTSDTSRPRADGTAAIYLDVSGSMGEMVHKLHAALVPLRRLLAPHLFVFSTSVEIMSRESFVRGRVRTTGGTDITPVLRHVSEQARSGKITRALVLTDGCVGTAARPILTAFAKCGATLHVGVVGTYPLSDAPWASSITRLPV